MKGLILAAGFGTRLLPHTRVLPKPLFTINNRPVLDMAICRLLDCGCDQIFINTHHLADRIRDFIDHHPKRKMIEAVHEPQILDTGGAMANLKDKLNDDDFLVINADIVCDFDLGSLMAAHRDSGAAATLLVHHCPRFNKLTFRGDAPGIDEGTATVPGRIENFSASPEKGVAFTGIQALSPEIFDHMPNAKVFSSIDVYKSLCASGRIRALKAGKIYWQDMGTPDAYSRTSRQFLAGKIFGLPPERFTQIHITPIAGDGSDRQWFRGEHRAAGRDSIVFSDHGICLDPAPLPGEESTLSTQPGRLAQLKAYTTIGRHLANKGIPVPQILGHDTISGQVALADLGSTHLADLAASSPTEQTLALYQKAIDGLIKFSQKGIDGFDTAWTCQTPSYSKPLIIDMECRYFMDAFVKTYLGKQGRWETLLPAFEHIADRALAHGYPGLMHRDFQSKNIMVRQGEVWFIDFQSARKGPIQYDLASLLIDPYVKLPQAFQDRLLAYARTALGLNNSMERNHFMESYAHCCLTRNLQMLGAFGFLTRVKHKTTFETHIPYALAGLKRRLAKMENKILAPLAEFVNKL